MKSINRKYFIIMKSKELKLFLISLILLIPSIYLLCAFAVAQNNTDNPPKFSLNVDATIRLNKKVISQAIFSGEEITFSVEVPARKIHIKVSWDSFWGMDLSLIVANDDTFSDIVTTSDNPGSSNEKIDLKIENPKTLYIKVYCNSGQGFFNIIVSDDTSAIILSTILIVVICVISIVALLVYNKLKKRNKTYSKIPPDINPYRSNRKVKDLSEEESQYDSNVNFCVYCGQKLANNAKICENCGTEAADI